MPLKDFPAALQISTKKRTEQRTKLLVMVKRLGGKSSQPQESVLGSNLGVETSAP
jgi:hypothetical protein